jgi:signal transduction histidine kinase
MTALSGTPLRRLLIALAVLTAGQVAVSVWFMLATEQEHDLAVDLIAVLTIGCSFAGTGLFAWWRRPENLVGPLMFLTGFFWFFNVYTLSDTGAIFAFGYIVGSVSYAFLIHLMLAFPDGRLETRLERAVVAGGYLAVTFLQFTSAFLLDPAKTGCEDCPENPLLGTGNEDLYTIHNAIQSLIAIAVLTGLVVAMVRRWRTWPLARRKQFAPVLWAGGISLTLISASLAVSVAGLPDGLQQGLFLVSLVPFAFIPFAFLAGLLRSRISRAESVSDLVAGMGTVGDRRSGLRDALAEALSDPSVELAYWVPETASYVDAGGTRVQLPADESGRRWAEVTHDGRRVGAIIHGGKLDDSEELVGTIAAAAGLRMENERLDAELRARVEELRASRARIVEAGYAERRRVERDLHDGAQQRLISLALNLRLARSKLGEEGEAASLLDEASAELEQATAELRELARGIHPGLLTDRGLVTAVEALASRATVPVELSADVDPRPPTGVEAAAYFVVSEALANIAKHAKAARASVTVLRDNGTLLVEIADDGGGGADPDGSGLRGIADRVAALDGRFVVADGDSGGTVVRATIPLG